MALTTLDIRKLTTNHYIGPAYPGFTLKRIIDKTLSINDIGSLAQAPYFMDFFVESLGLNRRRLPHEPLLKFGFRKNIVKTMVAGGKRRGTVKEFINAGDWQIEIKGVCIDPNEPERYPTEQVDEIRELCNINEAVEVDNDILRYFEIYSMVIESVNFESMPGVPGAQAYVIRAVSDEDFYGELSNKKLNRL